MRCTYMKTNIFLRVALCTSFEIPTMNLPRSYTINSLRPFVTELGFKETEPDVYRRAKFPVPSLWAKLLEEIKLGHSNVKRRPGIANVKNRVRHKRPTGLGPALPEFPVPKVFFQKICDFRARISYSQSFLLKDLWFRSSAFKPTGPGRSEFPVPRVFFQKICGFRAGISCSQRPPLYPDGQWLRIVAKYSTARFCRELKSQSPVIPYPTTCLPAPPFRKRIFDG